MSKLLSHMADSNANIAEFKSKFNGENKDVIRFIFDIKRYDQITDFQNPNTLFSNIYNTLPPWIQQKFAQDKQSILYAQAHALPQDADAQQQLDATVYSVESMQKFFIRNWRPTCKRSNIFRILYSIRMRRNENPRAVVDRISTAVGYATDTIRLINETGGEQMQEISDDDITTLLAHVFCNTNNSPTYNNQGGINELMQKLVRSKKPLYASVAVPPAVIATAFTPYYTIAETIVADISGRWYAKDKKYEIQYYDPQALPLWETVIKKTPHPKPHPRPHPKPKRGPQYPQSPNDRKRQPSTPQSPYQPPTKRPRYPRPNRGPSNPRFRNVQCWRCGFPGHPSDDCKSLRDINGQTFRYSDRRALKDMPFRSSNRPPRNPPHSRYPRSPPKPSPVPSNPKPNPYKQYSSPHSPSHQLPHPSHPQKPQLHTLVAQLGEIAANDLHINADVLQHIQSLQSHLAANTDTAPRHSS